MVLLLSPWVRRFPPLGYLAATPRRTLIFAAILVVLIFGLYHLLPPPPASTGSFSDAARLMDKAVPAEAPMTASSAASPMDSAVAKLEARLAKGSGSTDDWELLAKSYEFLGRNGDAARARAHQLPGGAGLSVSGEVTLDPALSGKATRGETLFIVAKSVDSPGMPVAVFRSAVGEWPVKFTLDDSSSMMAGRTLSGAGRVTVDARISRNGQPMPARGDLQGSSGVVDPAARKPLSIRIDHVVP
jgi:cytochrome c-type biogenesis protein CcmH